MTSDKYALGDWPFMVLIRLSYFGRFAGCLGLVLALLWATPAMALLPAEVVLVANRNMPQSVQLAKFYASARNVPEENIVEMNLPTTEEMGMEKFDADFFLPLREALVQKGLKEKAKCLLTFSGVPLKLSPRVVTATEAAEVKTIQEQLKAVLDQLNEQITAVEKRVSQHDPKFVPGKGTDMNGLLMRADAAMPLAGRMVNEVEAEQREPLFKLLMSTVELLGGQPALMRQINPNAPPAAADPGVRSPADVLAEMRQRVEDAQKEVAVLSVRRYLPENRAKLRKLSGEVFGLLDLARLIQAQIDYLSPDGTKSVDNELALLWWDQTPRKGMMRNPLNFHWRQEFRQAPPMLMVSRLDGPQSGTARDIVMACKLVEKAGLTGKFVIDSRGMNSQQVKPADAGYAPFDQKLRDLADMVRKNTKLPLIHDDAPEIVPVNSVRDIALYCGWYKLRSYTSPGSLNAGAVAYHVASFEMVSLRNKGEAGWCRGLLNDGAAVTVGSVDEPYLTAFPPPDEFFPLLLTGKLTVAEVYWLTNPLVCWRMVLIGDPLYNPYAAGPQMKVEDLPQPLQAIFASAPAMN